jgi:2-polyprenyl-3-methyl-5-hydroxy-6-metoxy-1,4-benzoquinol methylase
MSTGTKQYWDSHANAWDSIYLDESPLARKLNRVLRKAIYERFRVAIEAPGTLEGKHVLDVGCGSGRYSIEAARRGAARVVGLDFAPTMLEIARKQAQEAGVGDRCEFIQGDFREFKAGEKFDVVVANGFFDYVAEPGVALRQMVELSRGIVVASFPGKSFIRNSLRRIRYGLQGCPVFFYSDEDIRRIAREAGLTDFDLQYMSHSGTAYMLVGRVGARG